MLEYKVVEQKVKSLLRGQMSAADLEALINKHAKQGWVLDRIFSAETKRFMRGLGDKDVLMVIFKREVAAVLFAFVLLPLTAPAHALILCTTPDGKTYAGDNPPPECAEKATFTEPELPAATGYAGSEETAAIDPETKEARTDAVREALTRRYQIERRIQQVASDRQKAIDSLNSLRYPPDPPSGASDRTWRRYRENVRIYYAERSRLLGKKTDFEIEISRLQSEFDSLARDVAAANGGELPSTWRRELNCSACP